MRILIITPYTDPAGVGITLKRAFDRWTTHEVRFVRRRSNWLDYPADILWAQQRELVAELIARADVVHMFDTLIPEAAGRPRVVHHHGSRFWVDVDAVAQAEAQGVRVLGSTHDLSLHGCEWVPNPVPVEQLRGLRRRTRVGDPPFVIQTPTRRDLKQTDAFLAAAAGLPHQVVDGVPWQESLAAKARASALFDSFTFGYGNTSLEAWGMGIPTVSGVSDPAIAEQITRALGFLPYLEATPATLREQLVAVLEDPTVRARATAAGEQAVHDVHDERLVVARWSRIYEEVLAA